MLTDRDMTGEDHWICVPLRSATEVELRIYHIAKQLREAYKILALFPPV